MLLSPKVKSMAVEATLPTLGLVSFTAAIDSINPCAIGVLILLLSVLLAARKSAKRMLLLAGVYIASVYVVYFLAGLGLMYFFTTIPQAVTQYISIFVGLLVVIAGLIEIKDFYWYGEGFSLTIPPRFVQMVHKMSGNTSFFGLIVLGAFVSAVELPCTGGPYLAIITLLSQYFDFTALMLLVWYNAIFVSPLVIITLMVVAGRKLYEIKKWKQDNKGYMRLFTGLLLVGMGWLLILIANGTINFG